ncbi:unnamed protein product [Neospora caninum Liverpool]|uniref:Apical membrane antigen 1 protein n=1 Tax=Neospora caninum (strain Liverpool) TaxID=572307 RepID=F0VNX2_NEOCL|nr:uncharacterized protein NCLIV_058410 [Neospora caninum Liverpool]CBZ55418.1 unnamed protein product [Neospora caninum Liverpool]|eukprot:XP_003885446.1 uncharacterized protein NCLIV_058410 [Neospora caninum Liverpool]
MHSVGVTKQNPWTTVPPFSDFMQRFNIPQVHGSGIFVDLGRDTEGYREVGGKCPVFGKFIRMHQPPGYSNNFLDDAPTSNVAARKPLPGGFNNPQVYTSGQKFSPVDDALLRNKLGSSGPKTAIGRCALYAYSTTAVNPSNGSTSKYKYPFVYDAGSEKCFVLSISAQLLKGEKYCSVDGSPSGLTWACFEPVKETSTATTLVYGSAFVGEDDPDAWQLTCLLSMPVTTREDCWKRVFANPRVASDAPTTYSDTAQNNWDDFWPEHQQSNPKSGGVGANWANFYLEQERGKALCAIFDQVPDCFAPVKGAVAYTALGSLTEVNLPQCDPGSVSPTEGPCNDCVKVVTECIGNEFVQTSKTCCTAPEISPPPPPEPPVPAPQPPTEPPVPEPEPPEMVPPPEGDGGGGASDGDTEEDESGSQNTAAIAGSIIGVILLLALIGAGFGLYYRKERDPQAEQPTVEAAGEGDREQETLLGSRAVEADY